MRFDDLVPQPFSLGANQIPFAEVLPLRSARRIEDVIQTDTRFALSQTPEKSLTPRYEANDDFVTRVNAAVTVAAALYPLHLARNLSLHRIR